MAVRRQCGGPGQPHLLHVHSFDSLTPLMNCCQARGDLQGACSHLAAIVAAMDTILGAAAPLQRSVDMCCKSIQAVVAKRSFTGNGRLQAKTISGPRPVPNKC